MDIPLIILVVGIVVFLSHLFSALFDKMRIPDVLPLISLGLLAGPVFHLVKISDLGEIGPIFTTLALAIILFEGGLDLNVNELKESLVPATKLAMATFLLTFLLVFCLASYAMKLPALQSTLLSLILCATSPPLVMPILSKLKIAPTVKTTLILESTFCEVISIILALAVLNASSKSGSIYSEIIGTVISSFSLALVLGFVAAVFWSSILKLIRTVENNVFCTPAFVCIVYGLSELLGYSGPVASLAFGISLGNIKKIRNYLPKKLIQSEQLALSDREVSFFSAIVFLIKTFFFIYLGITIHFNSIHIIIVAITLGIGIYLTRLAVVRFSDLKSFEPSIIERMMMVIMIPKGLASAVLANLVVQSKLKYASDIEQITYGVILFSILLTAVLAFLLEKGYLDKPSDSLFKIKLLKNTEEV